jgi:hypothetical protein
VRQCHNKFVSVTSGDTCVSVTHTEGDTSLLGEAAVCLLPQFAAEVGFAVLQNRVDWPASEGMSLTTSSSRLQPQYISAASILHVGTLTVGDTLNT